MEEMNEENTEGVKALESQIRLLRAEVAELQRQQQDTQKDMELHRRGTMQDALSHVCGPRRVDVKEEKEIVSKLKEEVDKMEEDLKRQTRMNGISLNSCTTKNLKSSGKVSARQICVSGHCSELAFQVEFQLSEVKQVQGSERRISDLNVVMDGSDAQSFAGFLLGVEENSDLLLLFRTLRTFSDRCNERCRAFQHFQEKYPSIVSLPGGCRSEVMALNHPKSPGCVFYVDWSVDVSKEGRVTPKINLLTKIPVRAQLSFPSEAVGGAGEAFQSMLRILGTEAAVEAIVRELSLPMTTDE